MRSPRKCHPVQDGFLDSTGGCAPTSQIAPASLQKCKLKRRAGAVIGYSPKAPAMAFNNGTAD